MCINSKKNSIFYIQNYILILFTLVTVTTAHSQTVSKTLPSNHETPRRNSFQLGLGTLGLSLDYIRKISSQVDLLVGGSYFAIRNIDITRRVDIGIKSTTSLNADFNCFKLLAEFHPITKYNNFSFVGGLGYFYKAGVDFKVKIDDNRQFTKTGPLYSGEQIGQVVSTIENAGIAPYAGINLRKIKPSKRIGFNFNIGTFVLKSPTATVVGTNLLNNNSHLGPVLEDQIKGYKWYPTMQMCVSYHF